MKNNHAAFRSSFFHEAINHTTFILVILRNGTQST